jgi:Head domain of trimeric autotransporter adhesin
MRTLFITFFLLITCQSITAQFYKAVKVDSAFLTPRLPADPSSGTNGFVYYNTTDARFKVYEGGVWKYLVSATTVGGVNWLLAGNSGTNPANDFIGTFDNTNLMFRTNNTQRMLITAAGTVGIGTTTPNGAVKLQVAGNISSPGINLGCEKFGLSAIADSLYATAIGYQANAKFQSTAVGSSAVATGDYSVALGQSALANNIQSIALGRSASSTGILSIAIGYAANAAQAGSIAIGSGATSTAANQFVVGSATAGYDIREAIFGMSESSGNANLYGGIKIRATNAAGLNVNGANLRVAGGRGTGTGIGGLIAFNTTPAGAAGSTLNAEVERMRITATGEVGIGNAAPTEKLDVTGNVRFSGALMPNNISGTSGQVLTSNGAGVAPTWGNASRLLAKRTTPTAAIANTETQVLGTNIPANTLGVGDIIRVTAYGIQTNSSAASTSIYRFRIGTTTLTGVIPASSTWVNGVVAKTNTLFEVRGDILVTAIGASGTVIGQLNVDKGFASATTPVGTTAAVTINTTVANIAEFTFISGATTTTNTFHTTTIEIIKN